MYMWYDYWPQLRVPPAQCDRAVVYCVQYCTELRGLNWWAPMLGRWRLKLLLVSKVALLMIDYNYGLLCKSLLFLGG